MSHAKDTVSLSSYGGSSGRLRPQTILKATLSNNTASMLAARYKWDKFEVYGGYTYARRANPSAQTNLKIEAALRLDRPTGAESGRARAASPNSPLTKSGSADSLQWGASAGANQRWRWDDQARSRMT